MWEWLKQDKSGWSNFYLFLENTAKIAKKQLTLDSIMSALSGENGDKPKCSLCNKSHPGKCNKPKNAAAINQASKNTCPVCYKPSQKHKIKTGAEVVSTWVKNCPVFKSASDDQK